MSDPTPIPIALPSGMSGEYRRFKTKDYDLFFDRTLRNKKGPAVNAAICRQLWQRCNEPGLYQLAADGHPQWAGQVIEHDRFYLMMQARIASSNFSLVYGMTSPSTAALLHSRSMCCSQPKMLRVPSPSTSPST